MVGMGTDRQVSNGGWMVGSLSALFVFERTIRWVVQG